MCETQLMDKQCLVCVYLMASHLVCGQNKCYITVSQPVVNRVTNDTYVVLVVDFDLPKHHDTSKAVHICFKYYDVKGIKPSHEVMEGFPKILNINDRGTFKHLLSFGNYFYSTTCYK